MPEAGRVTREAFPRHLGSELLGGATQAGTCSLAGTDHRVERRLAKVHNQTPAPSAGQRFPSPPTPTNYGACSEQNVQS